MLKLKPKTQITNKMNNKNKKRYCHINAYFKKKSYVRNIYVINIKKHYLEILRVIFYGMYDFI